jgi:hypothetical protein
VKGFRKTLGRDQTVSFFVCWELFYYISGLFVMLCNYKDRVLTVTDSQTDRQTADREGLATD